MKFRYQVNEYISSGVTLLMNTKQAERWNAQQLTSCDSQSIKVYTGTEWVALVTALKEWIHPDLAEALSDFEPVVLRPNPIGATHVRKGKVNRKFTNRQVPKSN